MYSEQRTTTGLLVMTGTTNEDLAMSYDRENYDDVEDIVIEDFVDKSFTRILLLSCYNDQHEHTERTS